MTPITESETNGLWGKLCRLLSFHALSLMAGYLAYGISESTILSGSYRSVWAMPVSAENLVIKQNPTC